MAPSTQAHVHRLGVDENGLGARLGPLLVTAVLARTDAAGQRWLGRRLGKRIARDLDDSKRLVSFGRHQLGEAWARALCPDAKSPAELLAELCQPTIEALRAPCPPRSQAQCWSRADERFCADEAVVRRIGRHVEMMRTRGVDIVCVRSIPVCVGTLNAQRKQGKNRFTSDLHAMEELVLALRGRAGAEVVAICGKVGGICDYPKHFGPLSGRLHVVLEQQRRRSAYRFPGLGEVHFVQDADASDPLVMLASMVGKYLRELLMARISGFYTDQIDGLSNASGYHDPVTGRLVTLSAKRRKGLGIAKSCFERASDA
jgi:ribonuclease HII